jgi:hypothetical protein
MRGIATISILALVLLMAACRKEHVNPFDRDEDPVVDTPMPLLPLDNFAGLHQRIFRPTCAVSGCHDGSFEPDLRTIGSAYNSLVYHPVIGNDPTGSFTYRVMPGDHQASYLHERLVAFVPNTSGIMPLGFVEGSDWPAQQHTYIQAIRNWIDNGARDMFGTLPTLGNLQPQAVGLLAFNGGQTNNPFPRVDGPGVQPIAVPAGMVDVWFAFVDDQTAAQDLTHNTYKFATSPLGFDAVPEQPFTLGQAVQGMGFGNSTATFTHKASLDLSGYPAGTQVFVRAYVNDGDQPQPVEIPNDGTGSPMRDHFTLIIVP